MISKEIGIETARIIGLETTPHIEKRHYIWRLFFKNQSNKSTQQITTILPAETFIDAFDIYSDIYLLFFKNDIKENDLITVLYDQHGKITAIGKGNKPNVWIEIDEYNQFTQKNEDELLINVVYGIYPGSYIEDTYQIESKYLKTCPEQELYHAIHNIKKHIKCSQVDFKHGYIKNAETLSQAKIALEYCMMQTTRFGVEFPTPMPGVHVPETETFKAWYAWWNDYISSMEIHTYTDFLDKINNSMDVSQYKPIGNWLDNLTKENK